MKVDVKIDEALMAQAQALTGIANSAALVHEALRALVARESGRQLAMLGGSEPQIGDVLRRTL